MTFPLLSLIESKELDLCRLCRGPASRRYIKVTQILGSKTITIGDPFSTHVMLHKSCNSYLIDESIARRKKDE